MKAHHKFTPRTGARRAVEEQWLFDGEPELDRDLPLDQETQVGDEAIIAAAPRSGMLDRAPFVEDIPVEDGLVVGEEPPVFGAEPHGLGEERGVAEPQLVRRPQLVRAPKTDLEPQIVPEPELVREPQPPDGEPTPETSEVEKMLDEGGGVVEPNVPTGDAPGDAARADTQPVVPPIENVDSSAPPPQKRVVRWLEDKARVWGLNHLERLVQRRGKLSKTMAAVPRNMHRVANQTQLVLELIDDFRAGTYRAIPWRSMVVLIGVLLYTVSPADVIPDTFPLVGALDDLSLVALATRFVDKDLRAYCRFKGYSEDEYFRVEAT